MFSISNNSVLDQVVHRKNVLIVEQNFDSQPKNPFMLIDTCIISHTSLRQQTEEIQFLNKFLPKQAFGTN